MKKIYQINFLKCVMFALILMSVNTITAQYSNQVTFSGTRFAVRINGVDSGTESSLGTAINRCIGTGNRTVHILAGGTINQQINLQPGLILDCHSVTFNKTHTGVGFFRDGAGPITIKDMNLNNNTNFGIRTSRASNVTITNVRISGGGIGIRIDSHPSRPYEAQNIVRTIAVNNCSLLNTSGHGLETYGVDGFTLNTITTNNNGECGVLLNRTFNGRLGTVNAFRSGNGTGYAGLRLANDCDNIVTQNLIANECGRGYFVLTGSKNSTLNNCRITNGTGVGIWLENVVNCRVLAGCTNDGIAVTGSGSSAAGVSQVNCSASRFAEPTKNMDIQAIDTENAEVLTNSNQLSLEVSPNPTTGEFTISLPDSFQSDTTVNIYNVTGSIVKQEVHNTQNISINIADLPKGIYVLSVTNSKSEIIKKIIKN
ncbi:T9SS type A sorting domain-containing protein [Flavobacterium sp. FZUC8N2.13]|uniref:T9SS type A sorting domain-containing protein n=1 Tax=Flavobacterium zubiriense TaxID=3138075 RepID=A0ABV4TG11_9FLAO